MFHLFLDYKKNYQSELWSFIWLFIRLIYNKAHELLQLEIIDFQMIEM